MPPMLPQLKGSVGARQMAKKTRRTAVKPKFKAGDCVLNSKILGKRFQVVNVEQHENDVIYDCVEIFLMREVDLEAGWWSEDDPLSKTIKDSADIANRARQKKK
jgi:hypothetical protein